MDILCASVRPRRRRALRRRSRGIAGAVIAGAVIAAVAIGSMALLDGCSSTPTFDLQGHRGTRGHAPENTLTAFDRALELGVTTLELDTGVTRDGVVVIAHDTKLNPDITRDASGRWLSERGPAIVELDLARLQRYDVGRINPASRYAQSFAQQQPHDGERVPTLAALFARVKERRADHVRFNIETKLSPDEPLATVDPATFARRLLDVIDTHGMASRVTIQSFDWRTLRAVQEAMPSIPTVCLTVRQSWADNVSSGRWTLGITPGEHGGVVPRMVKAAGCRVWSPYFGEVDAEALGEARRLGLPTIPWTVNAATDIDRLLDLGVDGIISDYPDRVRSAMSARGMALPPQR